MDVSSEISNTSCFHQALRARLRYHYLTERDIYQGFLNLLLEQTGGGIGYLHHFNEGAALFKLNVWSKAILAQCSTSHEVSFPMNDNGIWVDCIHQRRAIFHNNYQNSNVKGRIPGGNFPIRRHMVVPAFENQEIVAILGVVNSKIFFTHDLMEITQTSVDVGWPFLRRCLTKLSDGRAGAFAQFQGQPHQEILANMIGAISQALEARDEYTANHQLNVEFVSSKVAECLNLDDQTKFGLSLGTLVHDIGKIAIPAEILNKPGRLSSPEFDLLKTHTGTCASFFSNLKMPWPIADMVRQHHERMDGSGYPDGLKGDDICLEARIISVADTFDAMASGRPYRAKIGAAASLKLLREKRGYQYDSYVIDAFLECYSENSTFDGRYQSA